MSTHKQVFLLCSYIFFLAAEGYKIKSYNFNKYSTSDFKFDCLHTSRTNISIPKTISFCYRYKPVVTPTLKWVTVFVGNVNNNWTQGFEVDRGFDFAIWSYGPWVAARDNGSVVWISMGKGEGFELLAWRHSCLTINFDDGHSILFEDGQLQFEDTFDEYVEFKEKMPSSVNMISVGCSVGAYEDSNIGVVTDFQMFGRILTKQEMEEWTGCNKRISGDIISWDTENWYFNKTEGVSEIEYLEFDENICNVEEKSNHVFPIKASFQKALKLCEKVSGKMFM